MKGTLAALAGVAVGLTLATWHRASNDRIILRDIVSADMRDLLVGAVHCHTRAVHAALPVRMSHG